MCDCFHLAFPNWHAASSGTGAGRRLRGPQPGAEDNSICDEPSRFAEGERPRPQGSSPVEEYPETEKYSDSDKECEAEHDPHHKTRGGQKTKKSGLGSMFEKRSTPKMSKLKEEAESPESGVIVKTAKDGCAEGLVYGGGGKDGIFIKEVVPESPASKSLNLKEGDQILSATVYFDNMSYEDAIQILEHAQAYKVKLCLKRKPDIKETEPVIESDAIPEKELHTPEMREQGKTKRGSDARISWPKFPSFGKGRKSHFRRSHSSSEADEQRKLELSPTTSDTESPIKSKDALKGKKRHKIKLSALTKRGRISSSEDQDTDTTTTGQMSGKILQSHQASDMLSLECLESPSGETPEFYVTEDLKVLEDSSLEQNDQKMAEPQTVRHKVELITIDSTLKTTDLTVALADKENSSGIKSPNGKKKERSELKMKILGKDKSHKKNTKAKVSPKRLKTLGASIEIPAHPEDEKSDVIQAFEPHTKLQGDLLALDANTETINRDSLRATTQMESSMPKVELDISDVAFIHKYPQRSAEKIKKGKDDKQKQETKTGPTFKPPKIGLSGITTEETIQTVEECTTKMEHLTTKSAEWKEDPFEQLSKSSLSKVQLPKREEIEIPGMEDMSMRSTAKGIKQPKAGLMGHYEELQAETVQLSIDVDSVKEAVSKLPGYKLPKVDMSGLPIPEEITVIDANAQRISVKTPTKAVGTKAKDETQVTKCDITAPPEISKTTVKLPRITHSDLNSGVPSIDTKADLKKSGKKYRTKAKKSEKETEVYRREDIIIPGKESPREVSVLWAKGKENIKSEYEVKTTKTEERKGEGQIAGVISDVKIPEIDSIEYIDSGGGSPGQKDCGILHTGFGVNIHAAKPNTDISFTESRGEVKDTEEHTIKLPKFGPATTDINVNVAGADMDKHSDGAEIKTFEREGKGSKFKMPTLNISMPKVKGPKIDLSKKDVDVKLPDAKAEVKHLNVPEVDKTLGNINVTIPELMMEVENPELEAKSWTQSELDGKGGKFKMPKLGIKMPKIKGPEFDLNLPKGDVTVTLPYAKAEGKLPEDPEIVVKLGSIDVSIPEQKVNDGLEVKPLQTDGELDGRGSRFKMPKLGIAKPKVKGPEVDLSFSKKDRYLPEPEISEDANIYVNAEKPQSDSEIDRQGGKIKMPDLQITLPKVQKDADVTLPEAKDAEGSPSKFKISSFIQPTFEGDEVSNKTKVIQMPSHLKTSEGIAVVIKAPKTDVEGPSLDVKTTAVELDVKDSKFKMPKFGISLPKLIGPETDLSSSKRDADVTLHDGTPEDKLADVEQTEPGIKVEVKVPEITVHQQDAEGSPSKFKMSTYRLPKFGVGTSNISGKVNNLEKDVKIDAVVPSVDFEGPSEGIKNTGIEHDQKGNKFKLPNFGLFMPKVKGPKIDPSLKKNVDVTLPEAKADVTLPEVDLGEVDISISETKTKVNLPEAPQIALERKPSECEAERDDDDRKFKGTKFGIKMPELKGPEFELSLSKRDTSSGTKAEVKLLEVPKIDVSPGKVEIVTPEVMVELKKPEVEIKPLQTDGELEGQGGKFKLAEIGITMPNVKGPEADLTISKKDTDVTQPETKAVVTLSDIQKTELDGQKGSFKMAKFEMSMPKAKGPEIDFGSSKKYADVILPKAKAEVNLLDVEPNETSAEVEIKTAEIETPLYNVKESASKLKLPTFKLQKFGVVKIDGGDVKIPEEVLTVDTEAPSIDTEAPSIKIKTRGSEHEGKRKKFKMPSLGFSVPQVERPEIDLSLSKKDVDVTLPEVKAEVKLPDVKEPSAEIEMRPHDITVETKTKKASPSKFKMPTFKLPKFGVGTPSATINVPDVDKDVKIDGGDIKIPEEVLTVDFEAPSIDTEAPSIQIKTTGTEHEGKGKKVKMPSLGFSVSQVERPEIDLSLSKKDVDVTLPEVKAEVKLPDVKLKGPSAEIEMRPPDITVETKTKEASPSKFKMPSFKLPKFGVVTPSATVNVPDVDKDVKNDGGDINIPEEVLTVDIEAPSIDTEAPSIQMKTTGSEHEGKGKKFKMPSLGFSVPQVERPEIDLSLPKKDVDVTLPEVKAEVKLPDVKLKEHSAEIEMRPPDITVETKTKEGSPSKFKMPTFKLPKFGVATPSATINVPDVDKDVKIDGGDIKIPEEVLTVDVEAPTIDTEAPSIQMKTAGSEHEGKGKKFKMPSLGFSVPQVERPEIDLSLPKKDVDVTLPEVKAEVKLPDVKLKGPSAEIEMRPPDITVETKSKEASPSKFKMPTFKLPKFGVGTPSATVNVSDVDKDVKIDGGDIKIPEEVLTVDIEAPSIDTEAPSIQMKTTGSEHEGKGKKFKMPSLGFSVPQVERPEIDLSLSKKDVDVTLPEVKAEVKLPDVKLKEPSAEIEMRPHDITVETKTKEASPSKFKMPTFKLPKFGVATPSATINVPDVDKDVKIDGGDIKIPEEVLTVDVEAPTIDTEAPSIQMKTAGSEHEGKGKKFKMPSLGFSVPQVERPEIDLSLSKKDVDVTLPEVKAEVKLPDVKLKGPSAEIEMRPPDITVETKTKEASPSKFKMPTFKLPKFGVGTPSATINVPDVDKDVKIDGGDIKIPEEVLTVDIEAPSIDTEAPSIQMKTAGSEHEGKGKKFKMPSLGFSVPQVERPEIDLSLSKKDVDVTLPEVKAEVKLPDVKLKGPSAEIEMRPPDITVETKTKEASPSKFKMPTFKLPKFGVGTPSATINVPDVDKDVKIDGGDIKIPEEVLTVDIEAPSIDTEAPSIQMKTTGTEHEGKGKKFKMPSLGFSVPQVERPEIDLSLPKKDVDVTLPEVKAEVKLPDVKLKEHSAEIEMRPPDITVETKTKEGSPSKFKMPTFKLPKFGVATPSATINVPDVDKDVKIDGGDIKIPEEVLTVDVEAPTIDSEAPSIQMKTTGTEHEGKGKKFKMPSLGFSVPQVERPEIDLSLPKKDVDVTLPKVKAEVKLPDVKLKEHSVEIEMRPPDITVETKTKEGSPSKFKMPTFKLPKFGVATPSATINVPDVDKDVKIDGGDIKIPEEVLTVDIEAPSIDTEAPSIQMKTTGSEHEGKGKKFKMPSLGFSVPQVERPEIDLSLSKKDVDVTLPEVKAEVKLPDVKLKEHSVEIEMRPPDITVETKTKEGSPSKFKMPTFKLPKFGVATPSATINVPDVDKDVKIDGGDIKIPEEVLTVDVEAPSTDTEAPSIQMKTTGSEHEGKGKKFKMPSLGFSVSQVERPEIDLSLSKKDVDVTLPEVKAEVKLPDVKLKEHFAEIEMRPPDITVETKTKEGSPSKFKMPTFKLPKFGVGTPSATINVPDVDKDVKIDGGDIKIPEEDLTVDVEAPSIDTEAPSIQMKTTGTEHEGKRKKFKMPSLGFSRPQVERPEIDLSLPKKDVAATIPEVKAKAKLPDLKFKEPTDKIEITAPQIEVTKKATEGSPSKYKMPTFKFLKFGSGASSAIAKMPDIEKDVKISGCDIKVPEEVLTADASNIEKEGQLIEMRKTGTQHEGKGKQFTMPSLRLPQVKRPDIDLSLSKKDVDMTLPEANAKIKLPDVELKESSVEVEIRSPEIKFATKTTEESPSKFKMAQVKQLDTDLISLEKNVDVTLPEVKATFQLPEVELQGSEIDLSLSKKDVDDTLPDAEAGVELPDVKLEQPCVKVAANVFDIEAQAGNDEGSASKVKISTITLPKFGAATPKVSVEIPNVNTDTENEGAKLEVQGTIVDVTAPSIDIKGLSAENKVKGSELEGSGSKFKMPKFDISMSKGKGPEIDLSLLKKDVDVTLPEAKAEVKLPGVQLQEPEDAISVPDAPEVEVEATLKRPSWTFPKFSFSKTDVKAPDVDVQIKTPKADVASPEAKAEACLPDVEVQGPSDAFLMGEPLDAEFDANMKKSKFSLNRFSFSKTSVKEPEFSAELPRVDISLQEGDVKVKKPHVELKPLEDDVELNVQGSKFKMPKFGISMPKVKGPAIDLSVSKKDAVITFPEAKAEIQVPDVKLKQLSGEVDIKAPQIERKTDNVEGSPSKFKMPTLTLPKFKVATPKDNMEVPTVDKDINNEGIKLEAPKEGAAAEVTTTSIKNNGQSVDEKAKEGSELEGAESKFKMPKFSISISKVKGPEIDLGLSKKDVDVTHPEAKAEVKLPGVQEPEGAISDAPDAPTVGDKAKSKQPNWTLPKFSFSRAGVKAPDADVNLETTKGHVASLEAKAEACPPDIEDQRSSEAVSTEEPSAIVLDANLKKSKFSLPRFSFSKSVKEPEVSAELPHVNVSLQEGEEIVKQPEMEMKTPELDFEHDEHLSMFKLPKFNIALPKAKPPEEDLNASQKDVDITLPKIKAEVKLPEIEVKGTYDVTVEAPDADMGAETDGFKPKENISVSPLDEYKALIDTETPKTKSDSVELSSPTKFKLPSFKMPKLSFSRSKPEDEYVPVETECKEDQLEMEVEPKGESKSTKMSLTSFGELLKNIDVEFDVSTPEKGGGNRETLKEVHETDECSEKQSEPKEKETNSKQDNTKSPERTGWFKFPKFGLSSPSDPAKKEHKDKNSPVGETVDEEISPTFSIQSSDAFADISSAMTSEHVGLSLSSPTKVTVKYSDPNTVTALEEMRSNIITSTTRTELISVEPNLPEKITILSSGASSSSDDTLRLESSKVHIITTNIQATPEAQHAKLLTAVQVQPAGGPSFKSESNDAASWTVEDSQSGTRATFERHLVREMSSERSESKETIVISKQIKQTSMFESSEPISGETASSIQRLRQSVHSEKMRFFDGAEK